MSDKTFTQEEVNALVGEARIKAREAKAKEFEGWLSPADYEEKTNGLNSKIADLTNALNSVNEELSASKTAISEKDDAIAKYELHSVKTRIANEMGLSFEATQFIQGDSEDAIRASAEALKAITKPAQIAPLANPEPVGDKDAKKMAYLGMVRELNRKE